MLTRTLQSRIGATRLSSSIIKQFEKKVAELPMREAVRYTGKNMKWTAQDVNNYAQSHANAIIEVGIKTGDTIAVWLPECAEKDVTLLSAAMMGLKVVEIDYAIDSVSEVREALSLSQCRCLYFAPSFEGTDKLLLLRKSIPEFYEYDDTYGQSFHSKHYPNLQYFIHTGFNVELGALNYKHLFLPNPSVSYIGEIMASDKVTDASPLYSKITSSSGKVSQAAWLTHKQVAEQKSLPLLSKMVNMEYFESS